YQWNEAFNHSRFRSHIMISNEHDIDQWIKTDTEQRLQRLGIENGDKLSSAQRMTFASTAGDIIQRSCDIRVPVILPISFAVFANQVVKDFSTVSGIGIPGNPLLECLSCGPDHHDGSVEGLFLWTIGCELMWQKSHRAIDGLFEVLYAFKQANHPLREDVQLKRLFTALSRHANSQSEYDAFRQWMCPMFLEEFRLTIKPRLNTSTLTLD
ncbi:hypothetical protein R3P38DRAFT_2574948, partial [Favolaschia claudopus]